MNNLFNINIAKQILAVLIGVSIPISTVLTNILIFSAVLLVIVEGRYRLYFQILHDNSIALVSLTLFSIIVLGLFYTPAPFHDAISIVLKYRELLFILLFILLFQEQEKTRQWGLNAFIITMGITLFLSYLIAITGWQLGKGSPDNPVVFKNHISQGILMSLACYFLAVQAWQNKKWRWLRSVGIIAAMYNVVFMTQGRTGYLALACLIVLFSYQCYRLRGLLLGVVFTGILSSMAYFHSDTVKMRIEEASKDMQGYQQGQTVGSIALRFEFLKNSAILVKQNPLFGIGTGGFGYAYAELAKQENLRPTNNPHSEYFIISIQWGMLGLVVFLYLLYHQWRLSGRLNEGERWMAQGLVMSMLIGCLVNSLLLDFTEGHLYAYLTGIFYAQSKF